MGAGRTSACATVVMLLLAAGTACGRGPDAASVDPTAHTGSGEPDRPPAPVDLEGMADDVISMLPPGPPKRPLDLLPVGAGEEVIAARPLLRAPMPDGVMELWSARSRGAGAAPTEWECTVQELPGASVSSCTDVTRSSKLGADETPMARGASSDGSSLVVLLTGPGDTTHFIVATDAGTVAVVPIAGLALIRLEQICPDEIVIDVAAWRGDDLLREGSVSFC